MARRTSIVSLEQIHEINVTPLIDLTFLLLITFIITFPMIEQGVPLNLPRGKAEDISSQHHRTISINLQGQIFLDSQAISTEDLKGEMNALGAADPESVVLVRADEGIAYGKVAEVVRILHDAKIARMALVTRTE